MALAKPFQGGKSRNSPQKQKSLNQTRKGFRKVAMDFLIWHLLRKSAERSPEKEALAHGEERLAYGQVARRVDGLAAGLRSAGLRRGDRMGIYLEASVPQVISIFG